jgi:hypothetical protein
MKAMKEPVRYGRGCSAYPRIALELVLAILKRLG